MLRFDKMKTMAIKIVSFFILEWWRNIKKDNKPTYLTQEKNNQSILVQEFLYTVIV